MADIEIEISKRDKAEGLKGIIRYILEKHKEVEALLNVLYNYVEFEESEEE